MAVEYFQETTNDWKCDFRVPCHTYLVENSKMVGYIPEGKTDPIMFQEPKTWDRRGRTFKKVKVK